jgi:MFS family permease
MSKFVKLSKPAVLGAANGVMFMTFFGALWASIGIVGSHQLGAPWPLVLSAIVTIILLSGAISLFVKSRSMNHSVTPKEKEDTKRINRKFGFIFGLEGVAIFLASVICNTLDHFEIFFPVMAMIVGIHFFPLASLFRENFYYGTGIVMCMLGIISLFLPINATFGNVSLIMMSTFIGFGSSLTLWVTGFRIWGTMLKKLKQYE